MSLIEDINAGKFFESFIAFIFLILPSLGWLLGPYYLLASYKNKTTIVLTNKTLSIKHAPIPWLGNRNMPASNLVQLYVRQGKRTGTIFNPSYLYDLRAKLKNGREIINDLLIQLLCHFTKKNLENII